ncbi:MAG: M56 family metallopeptidase [Victivallaceae bacterium]|nr:M56 family metallopeptidase [Victivallaceae bacterium]
MLVLSYLGGSVLRGLFICALLLLFELIYRRKLMFAGAGRFYMVLFMMAVIPCGLLSVPQFYRHTAETVESTPIVDAPANPTHADKTSGDHAGNTINTAKPGEPATAAVVASADLPEFGGFTLFGGHAPTRELMPQRFNTKTVEWIMLVYGLIALGLTAKRLRQFFIWRGRIRRCIAITGGRVFDIFQETKRKVGLTCEISLRDGGTLLSTPASFDCLPGKVLLCPLAEVEKLTDAELEMLMIHELGHFKHSDNLAALLGALLADFLWVNVFLRFFMSRFALARELECDALVRSKTGAKNATYARLLLSFQLKVNRIPIAGLGATAENLKLRIEEFSMKNQLKHKKTVIGAVAMFALCGALASPALAGGPPESAAPAKENTAAPVMPGTPAAKQLLLPEEWQKLVPADADSILYISRSDWKQFGFFVENENELSSIMTRFPSVSQLMVAGTSKKYVLTVYSEKPLSTTLLENIGNGFYRAATRVIVPQVADEHMGISQELLAIINELPPGTRSFAITSKVKDPKIELLRFSISGENHQNRMQLYVKTPDAEFKKKVVATIEDVISAISSDYLQDAPKPTLKVTTLDDGALLLESETPEFSTLDVNFFRFITGINSVWLYNNFRDRSLARAVLNAPNGKELMEKFAESCKQKLLSGQYSTEINGYPLFFRKWKINEPAGKRAVAAKLLMGDYMLACELAGNTAAPVELFEELDKTRKEMAGYTFVVVRDALVADGKLELAAKYCIEPYKEFEKSADVVLPYIADSRVGMGAVKDNAYLLRECGDSLIKIAEYKKLTDDAANIRAGLEKLKAAVEKRKSKLPAPPQVVSISPANGATDVSPNVTEIVVTFDRPMRQHSWAFCQNTKLNFPEDGGEIHYTSPTTVVFPVKLKPGTKYNIWLNGGKFIGFRSENGGVLEEYAYTFTTAEK